ncbi:cytochrome c oxidase subunit 7B, mitochondrial-like [Meles meles]|uniref:cytochrome c oxidase subunit 7B, mitochondrial-like n=1 Tax=Meles meles TaxID=9662 RepID=UPI001E69D2B4|nr:cytochrome c oxidase subunit 7B, mitochondrial-like [Meles meles]
MFLMVRNALSRLQDQSMHMQEATAIQRHQKQTPNFHDKYGNAVLASGATFCVAVRAYTTTQTGTEWILFPVGSVTPKEWRDQ